MSLLNRETYRANISLPRRRVVFRQGERQHGCQDIISISDLLSARPRYTDTHGEFLIEVQNSSLPIPHTV